ncbi:hypothetical protein J6590_071163 [Homalodisca vitripennis]|nr:hypothetical protein J6590_071163 [Homalodisca vitripennis]
MNHDTFSKWFRESLLPNLSTPSVIVMDNAPYHSKILDKAPTQEAWAQEGLIETAVEEMIIHVNGDDSDSETSDFEDFADEYRVQTDQGTQEIYVNRMYADVRWRAPSDVLFSVFGEKVTAHGSARTNAATLRHQSPHCSLPLHTLPIRKLYLFDYRCENVQQPPFRNSRTTYSFIQE